MNDENPEQAGDAQQGNGPDSSKPSENAAVPPTSWYGVPCDFVRVRMGLPVVGSPTPRSLWLIALQLAREVQHLPPFLRLGAQFFTEYNTTLSLA